ncbi:DUF4198 domain-containing protein [Azoarcus sp. TTM-91]|uniref:DUF4198 domain-containing protein n=1 Tax=Azoarcus sp. TTM-91 TaxID=2691581 RepID=UPI00145EC16E|nr:DUF4198 domain-containing protein [Azoarcus sp. TTM-91]NMG35440.1 DUF4198 domain-containing protein [Azoarcus sp. TTM-91]
MKHTLKLAAALAFCLQLPAAHAHNFWLLPSSTVLSKASYITVDAAVANDVFHFNHVPLRVDNLVVSAPDGSTVPTENLQQGKLRTVFDLNLTQTGTYRLAVVNDGIMAMWKEGDQPKRFRGNAENFAKEVPANATELRVTESVSRLETFVTVGKPSAIQPTGKGLELVPVTHPNDLFAGESATFRFQVDGKPAAGIEVVLVRGGSRYRNQLEEIKLTTDAEGKFSVKWPQAGMYWLDADVTDDKTTVKQAKERRLSYVATFEVLPE